MTKLNPFSNSIKILIYFSLCLLGTSCSIVKRQYLDGYYFQKDVSFKKQNGNKSTSLALNNQQEAEKNQSLTTASIDGNPLIIEPLSIINANPDSLVKADCDKIILKDKTTFSGKVIEITLQEIKFKKCDYLNGPTISISKPDVLLIEYANGTMDIIKSTQNSNSSSEYYPKSEYSNNAENKKLDGLGVFSFILGAIGFWVFGIPLGIIALLFGIISISRTVNNPERFKRSIAFPVLGIIWGIVDIVGALLILNLIL